ncbi:acetyl-CoA:L-glutamate N-acetyltransferase [Aspergillus mulundensis]|uniref:Amino-acid acetyltransferase, mitochondrial n=1 Tax=Aspergillus mulundensis TaxID=1810919 RepID=A0A3D8SXD8_9EURO|nr:Amino-acid acetyltransferase, mitochondrial [Aspergillus mulundensis]RDW90831.1 Amino-acid acetyltransferase, mitochondrial [Aspergillus mulundensis]
MSSRVLASRAAQAPLKRHPAVVGTGDEAHPTPRRCFSSSCDRRVNQSAEFSSTSQSYDRLGRRAKEKLLDRDFFMSLLNSASTKREAKSYLARLKAQHPAKSQKKPSNTPIEQNIVESLPSGVNLGSFYGASRSVYQSPVFRQDSTPAPAREDVPERLHLALVKIKTPQLLDDTTLNGVARTLSQINRLGLACCVVVDPGPDGDAHALRKVATEQIGRIATAVDAQPDSKSSHLYSVLSFSANRPDVPTVSSRKQLLGPLRDGHILIVAPIAYTEDTPKAVIVPANDAVLALTKELAGLATMPDPDEDPMVTAQKIGDLQKEVSLDRVILLDPLGGVPAFRGPQTSHAFINMDQEFENIERELLQVRKPATESQGASTAADPISDSNPLSKFTSTEIASTPAKQALLSLSVGEDTIDGHLDNLRLSQQTLAMLPSASSGIITSPVEVANSARSPEMSPSELSVGTRRQRNPLIHNLLTDKPLLSSSLPLSRRARGSLHLPAPPTTFVKRGMPVSLIPDPRVQIWTAQTRPSMNLDDPTIDLPRLLHLIEDSFNRKLDVKDYLNRVNGRLAGLIIAGEYEGGAILTWELPPGVPDDGSEASTARMVPYLDKFAVLKRSQGAGGVADIVFNAMVRTCFPNGVCWRSRKDNPVNKWYFERSLGTWKLADTNWTMFWTTPDLPDQPQMFRDYEAVCRSIQPSWADDTGVVD